MEEPVARQAAEQDNRRGGAARLAARRRPGRDEGSAKAAGKRAVPKGKKGAARAPSAFARAMKLFFLVLACVVIGFFAVLVLDVSAGLIGQVRLGEVTVVQLWDKLVDRVLDRDLPQKPAPSAPRPAARPQRAVPRSVVQTDPLAQGADARAPLRAASPHEDAQHVAPRKDPQVENAKARLDELLGHL